MSAVRAAGRQAFSSLKVRNFRLYITAQLISVSGTWMQSVAQAWLILHLTDSGVALGALVGLQFLPMLLLGPVGGLLVDRWPKRRILFGTQAAGGVLGLILGILVVGGWVRVWEVFVLAGCLGLVNTIDNPARQSFVIEMVGRDDLPNAVSLNTGMINASRIVGPALGGLIITFLSLGACFFINAFSYVAVIVGLAMMRTSELRPSDPVARGRGQIRQGFRYVWSTRRLRTVIVAVAIVGVFAFNFTVTLALLAKTTFHGGAGAYSLLTSAMGVGAVAAALAVAHRSRPTTSMLKALAFGFGLSLTAVGLAPDLAVAAVAMVCVGATSMAFMATANATLQLTSAPALRGRVMALYAMAFLGTTPIGAPLVGAIARMTDPRVAILVGAASALGTSGYLVWRLPDGAPQETLATDGPSPDVPSPDAIEFGELAPESASSGASDSERPSPTSVG